MYIDWVTSKQLLALSGVVSAGMGVGAAIGFLDLCGYMYNNIVVVVPFLVVCKIDFQLWVKFVSFFYGFQQFALSICF